MNTHPPFTLFDVLPVLGRPTPADYPTLSIPMNKEYQRRGIFVCIGFIYFLIFTQIGGFFHFVVALYNTVYQTT